MIFSRNHSVFRKPGNWVHTRRQRKRALKGLSEPGFFRMHALQPADPNKEKGMQELPHPYPAKNQISLPGLYFNRS